jgi:hypothetical protein
MSVRWRHTAYAGIQGVAGVALSATKLLPWATYRRSSSVASTDLYSRSPGWIFAVAGAAVLLLAVRRTVRRDLTSAYAALAIGTVTLVSAAILAGARISTANDATLARGGVTSFGSGAELAVVASLALVLVSVAEVVERHRRAS